MDKRFSIQPSHSRFWWLQNSNKSKRWDSKLRRRL